jgi:potassium-transporting ATPase KdpC subunit
MMLVMTILTGFVYPAVITVIAQVFFRDQANGSLIVSNDVVDFLGIKARIVHYSVDNGLAYESSVSLDTFKDAHGNLDDVKLIKAFNDEKVPLVFTPKTPIPADAVTASSSGLDPHISSRNAELQAARIAKARAVRIDQVQSLIAQHTEGRGLGLLGEPHVNVLELNLALDQTSPHK